MGICSTKPYNNKIISIITISPSSKSISEISEIELYIYKNDRNRERFVQEQKIDIKKLFINEYMHQNKIYSYK